VAVFIHVFPLPVLVARRITRRSSGCSPAPTSSTSRTPATGSTRTSRWTSSAPSYPSCSRKRCCVAPDNPLPPSPRAGVEHQSEPSAAVPGCSGEGAGGMLFRLPGMLFGSRNETNLLGEAPDPNSPPFFFSPLRLQSALNSKCCSRVAACNLVACRSSYVCA